MDAVKKKKIDKQIRNYINYKKMTIFSFSFFFTKIVQGHNKEIGMRHRQK